MPATEPLSRRTLLRCGVLGAALATGACARTGAVPAPPAEPSAGPLAAPGAPAVELTRASSGRPEVALTFHGAGPVELARAALDELARHGAQVTVLAVGTWLASNPDAARMVLGGGHELGNHTWSHPVLTGLGSAGVRVEVQRCRDVLVAQTGSPGPFFRPSSTQHASAEELQLAGEAGYARVLGYDVDSRDWTDPGPAAIRRAVTAAGAGSVVSLHLGRAGTVAALPGMLDDLGRRGLSPVPATRLFR